MVEGEAWDPRESGRLEKQAQNASRESRVFPACQPMC
jgi:hypothetical protein